MRMINIVVKQIRFIFVYVTVYFVYVSDKFAHIDLTNDSPQPDLYSEPDTDVIDLVSPKHERDVKVGITRLCFQYDITNLYI